MAGNAWETEDRDSNGRWTSGGKGTASNQNEAGQISLKEKILDGAGRFLKSMNAATGLRSFVQSVQLAPSQLNDMAELFDLWSRADHWSASAFQGHFPCEDEKV